MDLLKKHLNDDEIGLLNAIMTIIILLAAAWQTVTLALGTNHFMITIISDSMKPVFERGDIVIIKSQKNYSTYDVIAFRMGPEIYVHRIIASQNGKFRTKGDSTAADQWAVEKEDVLGKVVLVVPRAGSLSLWLNGM